MEPPGRWCVERKMVRRIVLYGAFVMTALVMLALGGELLRSFWVVDGIKWPGGSYTLSDGKQRWMSDGIYCCAGRVYFETRHSDWGQAQVRTWSLPTSTMVTVAAMGPLLPTRAVDYLLWRHEERWGRSLTSSYIDPTGKDIRLQEERVIVPGWEPLAVLGGMWAWLFVVIRRARRKRRWVQEGRCGKCGYDLRTQHSGAGGVKCPECGQEIGQAAAVAG